MFVQWEVLKRDVLLWVPETVGPVYQRILRHPHVFTYRPPGGGSAGTREKNEVHPQFSAFSHLDMFHRSQCNVLVFFYGLREFLFPWSRWRRYFYLL